MLGVVEKARGHIAVDILYKSLSESHQNILLIVHDIVTLVFCVVLFWSGAETVRNWCILGYISTTEITVPMWIVMVSAPLGAIVLAFFGTEHLITDIRSLVWSQKKVDEAVYHE